MSVGRRPSGRSVKALLALAVIAVALLTASMWVQPVGAVAGHALSGVIRDVLPEAPDVPAPAVVAP